MAKPQKEATLQDLLGQMKISNRLLAAPLKTSLGQQELIKLLMSTGASAAEIADVLDTTAATVATTIQRLKKKSTARPVADAGGEEDSNGGN
jgi:DNA-binding CsgD family transcriptional regulator